MPRGGGWFPYLFIFTSLSCKVVTSTHLRDMIGKWNKLAQVQSSGGEGTENTALKLIITAIPKMLLVSRAVRHGN